MSDKLVDLGWSVYGDGYRWVTGYQEGENESGSQLWLTERLINTDRIDLKRQRYYNPFYDTDHLHRRFCRIDPTRAGIAEFAGAYGMLGKPFEAQFVTGVRGDTLLMGRGEPYRCWKEAHREMQHAVSLYDAILDSDMGKLRELSFIQDGKRRYRFDGWIQQKRIFGPSYSKRSVDNVVRGNLSEDERHRIRSSRLDPRVQDRRPTGDQVYDAWGLLQILINTKLSALSEAKVLWDNDYEQRGIYLVPISLWGAMWLQFAMEVASVGEARRCKHCGNRFIAKRAEYCSDACRQKEYRKRLAESGESQCVRKPVGAE